MATDFSSLDKLMEFGLGLGIATQMMNTMNTVISRTAVPGVGINPGISFQPEKIGNNPDRIDPCRNTGDNFYVVYDEKLAGPLSVADMEKLIKNKKIENKTLCWRPGLNSWKFAEDIPQVNKLLLLNS